MTQSYLYSLSTDFSNLLNPDQFQHLIEHEPLITKLTLGVTVEADVVSMLFDEALTVGEQTALTALVTNYIYRPPEESGIVVIKEEETATGKHFQVKTIHVTAAASETKVHDETWDHPIGVLSVTIYNKASMEGDVVKVLIAPGTVVGALTSDVTAGDTTFNVSATVVQNMAIGYKLSLSDGTNVDDCGLVTAIDLASSTVTVNTATVNSFAAATPTYVLMTVCMMEHELPGFDYPLEFGESKIGASHIPAGKIVRII
jgi:hypothetical protein